MNKNKYVYVKGKTIDLREHMGSPPFFCGVCIAHFCSFLFFLFFALFVVVLCDYCVPTVASVLDCRFLIAPSIFSNAMNWFSVQLSSI
jgi:hypothetical protein